MLAGALAADGEHVLVDVADGGAGAGSAGFDDAEGDVAGAAGKIEQRKRRSFIFQDGRDGLSVAD